MTRVPTMGHNAKGYVESIIELFVMARGNLEERLRFKNELKRACEFLRIRWERVCKWFREIVRRIETVAREELQRKFEQFPEWHIYGV